jgi:hypothetical protein
LSAFWSRYAGGRLEFPPRDRIDLGWFQPMIRRSSA